MQAKAALPNFQGDIPSPPEVFRTANGQREAGTGTGVLLARRRELAALALAG